MPTRRRVSRALSEDAKKAKMEQWAVRVNLPKETAQKLLEKYGPYAYNIMKDAMLEPTSLMRKAGKRITTSKNAIKYFLETDLDTSQLAKIVNENELKVQRNLADYQILTAQATEQPSEQRENIEEIQAQAEAENEHLNNQVNARDAEKVELTDKQKQDMKRWARQIHLSTDSMNKLIAKYGTIAYDIVHDSMYKPSVVMRNMGERALGSSKKTIEYFLNNDIEPEKIAQALGKSVEEVKASIENKPENNQINDLQPTAYAEPPAQQDYESDSIENMSTQPAQNARDLQNKAYANFAKSEGKRHDIYLDCLGHPTTGVGHLIFNLNDINNPRKMEKWKTAFLDSCDYPNMNKEQQAALFDNLAAEMKKAKDYQRIHNCSLDTALTKTTLRAANVNGAGWNLTAAWVQKAKLNENGIRKAFNKDFDYWYTQTKAKLPQIDTYPLPVQLSAIHTAFAGKLSSISDADCRRDICKLMEKISRIRNPMRVPKAEGDTINVARRSVGLPAVASRSTQTASRRRNRRRSGPARA